MTKLAYFGGKPVRDKIVTPAYPLFSRRELGYIAEVLRSHQIAEGQFVRRLEENFADFIGTKYCVAVSSGTAALHLSLLSLGVGKGDEVITTPYTFIATSNACLYVGAKPVFVDIDPKTFNIDPEKIEKKVTTKTKAIMPVHVWGHPCEIGKILRIAKGHGLFVVEDASHAHGAEYYGKRVGTFGNVNCFSLYATKIITSAEGGLVTTDDELLASRIRTLKRFAEVGKYEHKEIGYNYRMSDVHAAIGLAQLERIDAFFKRRKQNAACLTRLLAEFDEYIELPTVKVNVKHAFYYYAISLRKNLLEKVSRDMFDKMLRAENIIPTSYYPRPLHLQEAYKFLGYKKSDFPVAEDVCNRTITLPIHPALNGKDMLDIYTAIGKIIRHFEG